MSIVRVLHSRHKLPATFCEKNKLRTHAFFYSLTRQALYPCLRRAKILPPKSPLVFLIRSDNDLRERRFLSSNLDGVTEPSEIRSFGQASRRARDHGFPIWVHVGAYAAIDRTRRRHRLSAGVEYGHPEGIWNDIHGSQDFLWWHR